MRNKHKTGFTLIEILVSLAVLIVGIVGILALFPAGLQSTKVAIEDTYAATLALSVYDSLRASAQQMAPGDNLEFFHDGVPNQISVDIPGLGRGQSVGIPEPATPAASAGYFGQLNPEQATNANFATLTTGNFATTVNQVDPINRVGQYSFNVELLYPPQNTANPRLTPKGLYDVVIRVRRANELIKVFHSKIFIPTDNP